MRTLLLGLVCVASIASTAATGATNDPLTNEEVSSLRSAVSKVWNSSGHKGIVTVRVRLNPDGTLAALPRVLSRPDGPNFAAAAASAIRAIQLSQPFRMLKPGSYDAWKVMDIDFNSATAVTNRPQPAKPFDIEKINAVLAKRKAQSTDPGTGGKN